MQLTNLITITPPPIGGKTFQPRTLADLNITIRDNIRGRLAQAYIQGIPKPLTLWQDAAYDAVGDYTQAQAEGRITELLGQNPGAVLQGLF